MTTTRPAVYRKIMSRLRERLDTDLSIINSVFVYLASEAGHRPDNDAVVQVVPGPNANRHPDSGVGFMIEEFSVFAWKFYDVDQVGRSDDRLTDTTDGLLVLAASVAAALIHDVGKTGDASPLITSPIRLLRESGCTESDEHPGWAFVEQTFAMGYKTVDTAPAPTS